MKIAKLNQLIGLDLRSLAICRIATALLILIDLTFRIGDLTAHYTDQGILSRDVLAQLTGDPLNWSLHSVNGTWLFQLILFAIQAVFAFGLLIGFRTTIVTVASWVLLTSLHNRNPMILDNSDLVLQLILFWNMFLPWGSRFSVDAASFPESRLACKRVLSAGTFALTAQFVFIYVFAALQKTGPHWTTDGSAIYFALSLESHALPFARILLQLPRGLLEFATFATWWFELIGPFLIFIPLQNSRARTAVVAAFMLFHAGMGVCLAVGLFPLISMAMVVALLPSSFWDRYVFRRVVQFRRCFDRGAARQSMTSHAAVLRNRFVKRLRGLLISVQPPVRRIASGRWQRRAAPRTWRESSTMCFVPLFLIGYVLLWNLGTLPGSRIGVGRWSFIGNALRLDQAWVMYAPFPYTDDGWFVIEGRTRDGNTFDLFHFAMTGESRDQVIPEKPDCISQTFKNGRWQKYIGRLWDSRDAAHRRHFADYLRRQWNSKHNSHQSLVELRMFYMLERTRQYRIPAIQPTLIYSNTYDNSSAANALSRRSFVR